MIVAGWADGYRNNSFRTVEALKQAGVPHRLLAGPWVHADPSTAYPGPRIDLDRGDGRLVGPLAPRSRGALRTRTASTCSCGPRRGQSPTSTSTRDGGPATPGPRRTCPGTPVPCPDPVLSVDPDVGTAAWIDCAGHLPWGLSVDQREDDARSLVWEWPGRAEQVIGHPRVRLRISVDAPAASLSVKLCDVFPDGTSALVTRGSLDLAYRDGVHAPVEPSPLVPGQEYDVEVVLDACAYQLAAGSAVSGSRSPARTGPTRSLPRHPSRSPCTTGRSSCRCVAGTAVHRRPSIRVRPRLRRTRPRSRGR